MRAALGAGRLQLIQPTAAESILLAAGGGALGLMLAVWARVALSRLLAGSAHGLRYDLSLDVKVLGSASPPRSSPACSPAFCPRCAPRASIRSTV